MGSLKVVMIPWLATGHITPFLELAKKLAKRNIQIFLCSTPINIKSIKTKIPEEYIASITLVEFHLSSSPELPPHYHTTKGLPNNLIKPLTIALDSAGPNFFSDILKTFTPDLVIYDFNQPWAPTVAASYNIPAVKFIVIGAIPHCIFSHHSQRPDVEFPFPDIQLKDFHIKQLHQQLQANKLNKRFKESLQKSSEIVLFNTFRGLEGKYIDYLSDLLGKKIVPVGPLVQEVAVDNTEEDAAIMTWLDEKEESSTVFVSFGSEYFLTKEEMEEIAYGLELSKVNFIWAVRFRQGEEKKTTIQEALPHGFLDRVRDGGRGLVVEGWAPQTKILAHPNTGGFVSHCGWNSTMESLKYGTPVIAVPMLYDQIFNAPLVQEVGVGLEVKREEDGRLDRDDIAQVIRKVVVEQNGKQIRVKANELSKVIELEGEKQIDALVQELIQLVD